MDNLGSSCLPESQDGVEVGDKSFLEEHQPLLEVLRIHEIVPTDGERMALWRVLGFLWGGLPK